MGNGDGNGIVLLCSTIAGLPAMLVLLTVLLPGYVKRARDVARKWPGRSFLLGLVNFVFFFAIGMLVNVGFAPVALTGVCSLFVVLPLLLSIGLAAAAVIAGEQLWQQIASKQASLIGALALGMLIMGLTLLVPVLGWLLFLGLVLVGLGASIIALGAAIVDRFRRKKPQPEPPSPAAESAG